MCLVVDVVCVYNFTESDNQNTVYFATEREREIVTMASIIEALIPSVHDMLSLREALSKIARRPNLSNNY